jgi:hypothetical protein
MKLHKRTIGLVVLMALIFLLSCQKEEIIRGFLPRPQTPKGFIDCLINGNTWPRYANSSNRITTVDFYKGEDLSGTNYDKCDKFNTLRSINFNTYYPQGYSDLWLSLVIKAETGTYKILYSDQVLDYKDPIGNAVFCQQFPRFRAAGITEVDAFLGNYYLDTDFANVLTISAVSDSIIEGSFHVKYLESNYARGSNNPNGVPDSLELDCKKFRAVLGKRR